MYKPFGLGDITWEVVGVTVGLVIFVGVVAVGLGAVRETELDAREERMDDEKERDE